VRLGKQKIDNWKKSLPHIRLDRWGKTGIAELKIMGNPMDDGEHESNLSTAGNIAWGRETKKKVRENKFTWKPDGNGAYEKWFAEVSTLCMKQSKRMIWNILRPNRQLVITRKIRIGTGKKWSRYLLIKTRPKKALLASQRNLDFTQQSLESFQKF
jgi:hypothetical protein